MAHSKVNRVVVQHTFTPDFPPVSGSFIVSVPVGYRVVSSFFSQASGAPTSWQATPLRSSGSAYFDQVEFTYVVDGPIELTATVIAERSDEPDVFINV